VKKFIKQRIIDPISIWAVNDLVNSNSDLKEIWEYTLITLPDLSEHYSVEVYDDEILQRIRLLIAGQTMFIKNILGEIIGKNDRCTYADVGDSDGSVRLLLKNHFYGEKLESVGVNLQETAVRKIREKGLDAICADALALGDNGVNYDVISVFETLEHLADPIGFLKRIKNVVKDRLVISVPYVRRSRIGLGYISSKWPSKWPKDRQPTIENTHIFELCPEDWIKIFAHTGWALDCDWKLFMFARFGFGRLILEPFWRIMSFDGFWFVSLYKDNRYSSQYVIE